MDHYTLKLAGLERQLPYVDINDELAYASFVVISDVKLIEAVTPLLASRIKDCDILMTAEAKGIALAYSLASYLGHRDFIVARKSIKSYMKDPISVSVKSITTTELQALYLDGTDIPKLQGKRVCLLDDVVSTGGSLIALSQLAKKAGANVCANACILAEGEAADRDDLIYLQKLPLFKKTKGGYIAL